MTGAAGRGGPPTGDVGLRPRAAGLLALAAYAAQAPLYFRYITDDTFIYARFARNLARHGELAFNPGHPVHAATSPLWAALGAAGARLGLEPFWVLKALGWIAGGVAVVTLARVAAAQLRDRTWTLLVIAVAATEPWLVRWSGSGLETGLAALVVVAAMHCALRPAAQVRWTALGWTLGCAPLVRPELVVLAALTGAAALATPAARRRPGFWIGLLLPMAVWSAYALPQLGRIWPLTVQAKSTPLGLQPARLAGNAWVLAKLLGTAALLPCAMLLPELAALPRRWRTLAAQSWLQPLLLVWIVLLPAGYLVRDVQVVSRYLEIVLPAIVLLSGAAARRRARAGGHRWGRGLAALWAAQAAAGLTLTLAIVAPSAAAFSRSWEQGLGGIARWLRTNTPPDAVVAIYDIGLVGYRSDRTILDLGGLVDPRMEQLRDQVDDREIVERGLFLQLGRADYLVDWSAAPDALVAAPLGNRRAVPVLHETVANRGLSRPGPIAYTLYRLEPAH